VGTFLLVAEVVEAAGPQGFFVAGEMMQEDLPGPGDLSNEP
jgi:hypothetical protein